MSTLVPITTAPPATTERQWTSSQQRAIAARARTLVTAAAGSGKTSVLTELVAGSLAAREIAPAQVCAVTFTEKAAQEMRERIAARLAALGERDVLAELELARIGTIHSLCSTVLRLHGAAVGVDPAVGQLDEAQHAWIQRDAIRHALDQFADDADVHWLRARMGDDRVEVQLRSLYAIAQEGDGTVRIVDGADVKCPVDPKSGELPVSPDDARRAVSAITRLWHAFDETVEARKHALGRISFDDLERLAVEAVRIPAVRTDLRARWGVLLVDEFQDTNQRQYELLDSIGADRLFMVGDEWQSIYRFRGADVDVFRARRDDPSGGDVVPMRENFRSDGPVLDVVNRVFGHEQLFGDRYEPVHPGTDAQRDVAAPAVELLVVPEQATARDDVAAGLPSREREAWRVAERVAQLVADGDAAPGDVALLYARGTGVDHYERALRAWGLPVLRDASSGYYDQRDVRDVLALLAAIRNRSDDHAVLSVLGGPLAQLEWSELAELVARAREDKVTLLHAAGSSAGRAAQVARLVLELEELARASTLVELVARVVELPRLELGAALDGDGALRVANLRRLVELAASAAEVGVRDVAGFLEFVAAQRRDARVGEASIADESAGAVRLMTVHASKGLEFPHVFVIEAANGSSGRADLYPAPLVDADGTVHVALPRRDGRGERTPVLQQLHQAECDAEAEESLRLWYVAMTRAKRRLYVSGRWNFTPTKAGKPRSIGGALRWLREAMCLPDDLGGPGTSYVALEGLVHVDTHGPTRTPVPVWTTAAESTRLATPLELPPTVAEPVVEAPDPHALRRALQETVSSARSDEWRQLDGTRVHDAVARLLAAARRGTSADALLDPEHGPWLTDASRERLGPVVASPVFGRLVGLRATPEVPYVASVGATVDSRVVPGAEVAASAADVDAGRIDALAVLPDGTWWVVDWKTTLPADPADAWNEHGAQLRRYAHVAAASGAPGCVVTLVPLDRPDDAESWRIDGESVAPTAMP